MPIVDHLKVFGYVTYGLLTSKNEKFDEKFEKLVFIGYSNKSKCRQLFLRKTNQLVLSRDVVLNENVTWKREIMFFQTQYKVQ